MMEAILQWVMNLIATATATSVLMVAISFMLREALTKLFAKSIEYGFEKRLEKFKVELREGEKELEQIRSFLVSARRDRDSASQSKRLEAAEALLRARDALAQLAILPTYLQTLNIEYILKNSQNSKITELFQALISPLDVDQKLKNIALIDRTLPRLYLSERTLIFFGVYEDIIIQSAVTMKVFSLPLQNKEGILKKSDLAQKIVSLVPSAKKDFDNLGDDYAYFWVDYFYAETLRVLRYEVSGLEDDMRDNESIQRLAINSRQALTNIQMSIQSVGLSGDVVKAIDPSLAKGNS